MKDLIKELIKSGEHEDMIDCAISELIWVADNFREATSAPKVYLRSSPNGSHFDFRNWNDLMPLVVEYLPMLGVGRREFIDLLQSEDPQRGLAECLLFALQEKQGDDIK